MVLKWNTGQKKALNIRERALTFGRGASAPYAPPPSPRYATVYGMIGKYAAPKRTSGCARKEKNKSQHFTLSLKNTELNK